MVDRLNPLLIVEHRINTCAALERVPAHHGVEIDVRDYDGALRLVHDPFESGELLEGFLEAYNHALLIVNVKCDGLEDSVRRLLAARGIENFFFLDCAAPTLVRLVRSGERRVAVRFSEFEPLEWVRNFHGRADWVWVDCFTRLPFTESSYRELAEHYRLCLVSPELQRAPATRIAEFRARLVASPVDAVCTDFPDLWTTNTARVEAIHADS
ncbi:MAG: hypothetical protein ACKVX7_16500 [Planctomycetota bacterium]